MAGGAKFHDSCYNHGSSGNMVSSEDISYRNSFLVGVIQHSQIGLKLSIVFAHLQHPDNVGNSPALCDHARFLWCKLFINVNRSLQCWRWRGWGWAAAAPVSGLNAVCSNAEWHSTQTRSRALQLKVCRWNFCDLAVGKSLFQLQHLACLPQSATRQRLTKFVSGM